MTEPLDISFNLPYITGKELNYIEESFGDKLSGDGRFTKKCHQWLEEQTGCSKALLTHSCTAALEMAALLLNIKPGDEIIMPSYTFVSTANAFVLQGGVPVFIDIRRDTLNMDERLIEAAITPKTKAIVPVHYAGVGCEMDTILDIAKRHNLAVVEDAAQGVLASYKGKVLGSLGDFGTYSFHESKNIISGEGGALLVNDAQYSLQAEIIREKGTDRSRFLRGEVDKYTWKNIGSSYLPGDMIAAFLWAQLEKAQEITAMRLAIWHYYHQQFAVFEQMGILQRPQIPEHCQHNGHMYYVILAPHVDREVILNEFKRNGIQAISHYVPLHSAQAGLRYGRTHGELDITDSYATRIIRLPLWAGLTVSKQDRVTTQFDDALKLVI